LNLNDAIVKGVTDVTKKWTKYQKQVERNSRARVNYFRSNFKEESLKSIAAEVMEEAYMKASAGGTLPAAARQIMYQARPLIMARIDKPLNDEYFTQTLLPDYLDENPTSTANWDVVFDARGRLFEPHTKREVQLGTIAVRNYLSASDADSADDNLDAPELSANWPTVGAANRFSSVLFIEKEGFAPLLQRARIAERFDLAIMSTKGVSTTAARTLIEKLGGVRFLVLHDFDKYGFSILGTLKRSTRRYHFKSPPDVVDLGLRLSDVNEEELPPEPMSYKRERDPRGNLYKNGATKEEVEFLVIDRHRGIGQRVELNAFASDHLITWLERKLVTQGVKKLVPDDAILQEAYRRMVYVHTINSQIKQAAVEAEKAAHALKVPKSLAGQIARLLKDNPSISWDAAVAEIVAKKQSKEAA
jgi:hypothetical protein